MLYAAGGGSRDVQVGEVNFHASLSGELLVGLTNWPIKRATTRMRKVVVGGDFATVPSAWLLKAVIYTPADFGKTSTVLIPAI